MDKTFRWFTRADMRKYEDKYVAIVGKRVVSANKDPKTAYGNAKKAHPGKEIVLWKVPSGDLFIF